MWAVLGGTFTLRFWTGLTGAMLAVYLAKLPEHGGPVVAATTLAFLAVSFFLSELAPVADLRGPLGPGRPPPDDAGRAHLRGGGGDPHRPHDEPPVLGGTRILEGASTAASVPSILGYIALATAGNEVLRGKAAARFEGATLAGLGVGLVIAPLLFAALGPAAFFLNALVYGVSFLIYRFGVEDRDAEERAAAQRRQTGASRRIDWPRYAALLRSSHVWLLAPTWIAVNASIGLWFSQSIFQFSRVDPRFPDQAPPPRVPARSRSRSQRSSIGVIFGAGLLYWGNRFKTLRRTTIILYGIGGGAVLAVGGLLVNHARRPGPRSFRRSAAWSHARSACSSSPGRPRPPLGLLADMSERFPTDRGAIMGLYSVFLAVGQIVGSLIGGVAADMRGHRRPPDRDAARSCSSRSCRSPCCGARSTCSRWSIRSSRLEPVARAEAGPMTA